MLREKDYGKRLELLLGQAAAGSHVHQTGLLTDLLFTALASVTPQEVQNKQEDSLFTRGGGNLTKMQWEH